jgi:hypothetical protein
MPNDNLVTLEAKIDFIRRQLEFYRKAYPVRVKEGSMPQKTADNRIRIQESILSDYIRARDKQYATYKK